MTNNVFKPDEKLKYLEPYIGKIIYINRRPFELFIIKDLGGDYAAWAALDDSYNVYATINYDNSVGVPISLLTHECCAIDDDFYPCELDKDNWFSEYCGIVKATVGQMIKKYEKTNWISPSDIQDYTPRIIASKVFKCLACNVDLTLDHDKYYGLPLFTYVSDGNIRQVAIGTEEQIHKAMIEFLKEEIQNIGNEFLARHTKIGETEAMIKAMDIITESKEEGVSECVFGLIEDIDVFINDLKDKKTGFREYLACGLMCDDIELKIESEGVAYYIYEM